MQKLQQEMKQQYEGLNLSSTLVLYQLDQQVACQRYRQNLVIAERKNLVAELSARFGDAFRPAATAVA